MGFIKALLAIILMILCAVGTGIRPNSPECFIGFCVILAGAVAHSEK
jgi:hypothetical protein